MPDRAAAGASGCAKGAALAGLVLALAASIVLTVAVALGGTSLSGLDTGLSATTRDWADGWGWPVQVAKIVGTLTQPALSGVLVAILGLWLLRRGLRAAPGMLAISGVLGATLTTGVKNIVARQRPSSAEGLVHDMSASYPSGHTSAGIYLWVAAGLVLLQLGRANQRAGLTRAGMTLIVLGPLIGVSRLVLGAHWPSDILGGWAFGSVALTTAALALWSPLGRGWRDLGSHQPSGS